jgi:membrane associated rhomboid family serine protease
MFPLKDNIPLARLPIVTVALVAINVIVYLLHAGFLHIFGNMVFLAIFGPTVEDAVGRPRFTAFYLLGGLVALGAQGFWLLEQLYLALAALAGTGSGEGVAYFAHIGGFAFGLLAIKLFVGNRRRSPEIRQPPSLPVY